jgi:hypothetical protein
MKLFLGTNCPQCEALKKRIDLGDVPGLEVHHVPASGVPDTAADAVALAEADLHDVFSVPALVTDGRRICDVFEILDELQGALAGETHGR